MGTETRPVVGREPFEPRSDAYLRDPYRELAAWRALRRQLFPDDDRVRFLEHDHFGDEPFGGAVDFGNEVVLGFFGPRMDGGPHRAAEIIGGTKRRALGELD